MKITSLPVKNKQPHIQIETVLNQFYPDSISDSYEDLKMDTIHNALPTVIVVLDFTTKQYTYISENVYEIFGIKPLQLINEGLSLGVQLVAEEYRDIFFTEILTSIMQLYQKMAGKGGDVRNTKLTYNIKMINKDGIFINTIHIFKPLTINHDGFPVLVAKYILHDPFTKNASCPEMKFEAKNQAGYFEVIFTKLFQIKQDKDNKLSNREHQILQFVKQGYTSQKIAEMLFISLYTVNTHRRSIAKKCGVKNLHLAEYNN